MSARDTLASWYALAIKSSGCNNLLDTGTDKYVIDSRPHLLANGAVQGRMFRFGPHGCADIGGFKIAADGTVLACPDEMRPLLPGAKSQPQQEGQPHEAAA